MTTLTDDEISELAECLWDACSRSELPVLPTAERGSCLDGITCPMALLFGPTDFGRRATGGWSDDFIIGFEQSANYGGRPANPTNKIQQLGRRFREQALSGEGFK